MFTIDIGSDYPVMPYVVCVGGGLNLIDFKYVSDIHCVSMLRPFLVKIQKFKMCGELQSEGPRIVTTIHPQNKMGFIQSSTTIAYNHQHPSMATCFGIF
jgi:hypothetical protein